jgi:hypothetical protein
MSMTNRPRLATSGFQKLYFGMASAEAEMRTEEGAKRFFQTFYDRWNLRRKFDDKAFFLVVGPKGVGKSAINEYMRLHLIDRYGAHAVFPLMLTLDQVGPGLVPLSDISTKLVTENSKSSTEQAWRLYLCLRFFDLLLEDQSCSLSSDPQALKLRAALQEVGLISSDYPSVLRRVRENKLTFSIRGFGGESTARRTDELLITQVHEALLALILSAESDNHFMVSIDGLDRIVGRNDSYWHALAALLQVAYDMHNRLGAARADIRLFVMCRSDVLRKIRFVDADKISGDASLFVDWAAQQTVITDSPLWDYLAAKAGISIEQLFAYLPEFVTVGQRGGRSRNIPTAQYLLELTRSTPRELTLFVKRIQEQLPPNGYVTSERLRMAADEFASRDLLSVVIAESTGVLHDKLAASLDDILSALPAAWNLTRNDLVTAVALVGLGVELVDELAEFLFMAGLLGNFDPNTQYVQFYHRRDTYKFKRQGPWVLHTAIMYAFNIPRTRHS